MIRHHTLEAIRSLDCKVAATRVLIVPCETSGVAVGEVGLHVEWEVAVHVEQ